MNPVHARTAYNACASDMPNGRVFIAGNAVHPHLPPNHHGPNSSCQRGFNDPRKLLAVPKGTSRADAA